MKILTIALQFYQTVEVDGEYKQVKGEAMRLPCFISNYALDYGQKNGFIKTSLLSGVLEIFEAVANDPGVQNGTISPDTIKATGNALDHNYLNKIIYLGCIGANPDLDKTLSYERFLQGLEFTMEQSLETAFELIDQMYGDEGDDSFINAFKRSTKPAKKK